MSQRYHNEHHDDHIVHDGTIVWCYEEQSRLVRCVLLFACDVCILCICNESGLRVIVLPNIYILLITYETSLI